MEHDPQEIALQVMKGYVNRAFIMLSEAWYGEANRRDDIVEEITIGFYHPFDEGTYGEFTVEWIKLSGSVHSRMKMFDEFWHLLPLFKDFLEMLSLNGPYSISPTLFAQKLRGLGFVDDTPREPRKKPPEPDYASQRLHTARPVRISEPFKHLFDPRLPFVVPFFGTAEFRNGILKRNPQVAEFLETNCEHLYRLSTNDVLFADEGDAMLCAMKFS